VSGRVTTTMVQRAILSDLNAVSGRLTRTQEKVASSKELNRPSDDPYGVSRAMALREELDGLTQYQRNVNDAVGWQDATETALARVTEATARARELLVLGGTDTADPQSRASVAGEIDQLIESLKQTANASYGGRYLFAGTQTGTTPYAPTSSPPVPGDDLYRGDGGMIARQLGPGVSLDVNVLGDDVLGGGTVAADDKLLHVLRDVADHLRSGDTAALRGSDLTRLDANHDAVMGVRALNGARTNRLEAALTRLGEVEQSALTQLSMTEDADIAKTLIEFNSQQAAYQAALRAGATIVQSSLMDFLR